MSRQMSFGPSGGLVEYKIRVNVDEAVIGLTKLNDLFTTYLALARRSGLPENMMQALVSIQQMRVAAQSMIQSIHALNLAFATGGPAGWLMGAVAIGGMAISGLMMADQVEIRRSNF